MAVVTDQTRNVIWQDLWDAERYVRYYGALADSYRVRHRNMRFALPAAILVEVIVFLSNVSGILFATFTVAMVILIATLAFWDAMSNYARKSAALDLATKDCQMMNTQWCELWMDIETCVIDESEARTRRWELMKRLQSIAARVDVDQNQRLNDSCKEDAKKVVMQKYA